MAILVVNCGSSSVKFAVIDPAAGSNLLVGLGQRLGGPQAGLSWSAGTEKGERVMPGAGHAEIISAVVELLKDRGLLAAVQGIGHRVVHGGARFSASVLIDQSVVDGIAACNHLGPLHNPPNLLGIDLCRKLLPGLPNVAVFDTAFHQSMPAHAYRYAVPHEWFSKHDVRKYGFHGTSHRFVSAEACRMIARKPEDTHLIVAHLGNGCSATAVVGGKSVDTTMGLTPLEGLMMGTRSGDLDPAVIGYMADRLGKDAKAIIDILNKQSGLQGVSGISNDMRALLKAGDEGSEAAKLAVEMFCFRLAKAVAGLAVSLERVDCLAFTGGIGENSVPVRARTIHYLGSLGFRLDEAANAANGRNTNGRITVEGWMLALVVPTNEELLIARDTAAIIG